MCSQLARSMRSRDLIKDYLLLAHIVVLSSTEKKVIKLLVVI